MAAQVHRDDVTDRPDPARDRGPRPGRVRQAVDQQDARARRPRADRPAPVEEVDPVARLDDDHEAVRLGSGIRRLARAPSPLGYGRRWPSAAAGSAPSASEVPAPPVRGARRRTRWTPSPSRSRAPSTRWPSSSPTNRATSSGARTRSSRTTRCTDCTRASRGPNGAPTGLRCRTGSRSSGCRSRRTSPDPDDLADEVWVTVIHELAHHLGIDDERLQALGID